jgi:7-cyano-7-deazaguanine synthase
MVHHLIGDGHAVSAVSFDYGQRHRRELGYAERLCDRLGVPWRKVDLSSLREMLGTSALTSDRISVPHGHYADETMKATIVPNRNMIMLAIATGCAIADGCDSVAYAAHSGDHAIYPDCRAEFAEALGRAITLCDTSEIQLLRPFVEIDKAQIVRIGAALGVDYSATWSCYEGAETHCGACGTCVERREAFVLAEVADPTEYAVSAPDLNDIIK